jgi:hypothetical protein
MLAIKLTTASKTKKYLVQGEAITVLIQGPRIFWTLIDYLWV